MSGTSADELPDAPTGELLLIYVLDGFNRFALQRDTTGLAFREYIAKFCIFLGFMRMSPLILMGIDECIERGYIELTPTRTLRVTVFARVFADIFRSAYREGLWLLTNRTRIRDTLRQHQRRLFGAGIDSLDHDQLQVWQGVDNSGSYWHPASGRQAEVELSLEDNFSNALNQVLRTGNVRSSNIQNHSNNVSANSDDEYYSSDLCDEYYSASSDEYYSASSADEYYTSDLEGSDDS